jgi:nucleoside-diphosphate-sugar epimerase
LEIVEGSADSVADWLRVCEGVGTVVHMAHIRFAPTLVEALRQIDRPVRLIVTSSTRLMSRYESPVREQVRLGEEAVQKAPEHVAWTILRPAMIFGGPSDHNIERLAGLLRKTPVFPLFGRGENLVQPLFTWDLVGAFISCLELDVSIGKTYVLAGPEAMTYRQMVEAVARAMGLRPPLFLPVPRRPAIALARLIRLLWPKGPIDPEAIRRFGEDRAFDIGPARVELGFHPTPFSKALARKFRREA